MKKLFILSSAALLTFCNYSFAQQWIARYNGTGNGIDAVRAMAADNSGNVYVTGSSNSGANSDDYITIKYNTNGVRQWLARYNGPGNGSDVPNSIFVDASGKVYVTGYSDQLTGAYINNDVATVKYNSQGVQMWVARYDGTLQRTDAGNSIKADADGNVYVAGSKTVHNGVYTDADYLTLKYNSAGVLLWAATHNGPANKADVAVGLGLDATGNVYVTGTDFAGVDPLGEEDYLTIKYNPSGVEQWTARYNGPINEPDRATAIAVDNAGNSYVTGYSEGTGLDFATVKYNTSGVQQWVARYNGSANSSDISYAIALDNSGNVYVTGGDQTTIYNSDFRTIKYNSSGVMQWSKRYNGNANDNDEAYAIATDASNNVYVTGYINGTSPDWNMATIKYNASGAQQWVKKYNAGHGNDYGNAVAVDGSGNVYVAGTSQGASSDLDFVTIKYNSAGLRTDESDIQKTSVENVLTIYPNPAQNNLTLQLPEGTVFDITISDFTGRQIFEEKNVETLKQIDCTYFPGGIYVIRAKNDNTVITTKFIRE